MADTRPWVIIVGAGPSGLLLALMLGRQGVPVQVLERGETVDSRPRATHYASPAVRELHRAGVADDARRMGFVPDGVCWRKLDGTFLAGLSLSVYPENDPNLMICLPLNKLGQLLLEHIAKVPSINISYNTKVLNVGQTSDSAWVDIQKPHGQQRLEAQYIVGCDGANSGVRRALFGSNFPGKTWDQQIVATNTRYDFKKYGYTDANFFIHPEHWHMVARISDDNLWRVTYGEIPGLTDADLLARQPMKFQSFLPGHPAPDSQSYELVSISPYRVHQRLAERMRVGRILLAADAAHLCNPFGGMGLTGGIADIGSLYDCLIGIYQKKASDSILDKYDEVRRRIYNEVINPVSSANITRLFAQNPETALADDEFLRLCKKAEADPSFSREMQNSMTVLVHDFTQYYDS